MEALQNIGLMVAVAGLIVLSVFGIVRLASTDKDLEEIKKDEEAQIRDIRHWQNNFEYKN